MFDSSTHVKVRLLYDAPVAVNFKEGSINRAKLKDLRGNGKIIIHFHGGGFMCQDSHVHSNYTIKWATDMGIPVFSVDYRLAPKNPYPDPQNDCYQAYVWIVTQAQQ